MGQSDCLLEVKNLYVSSDGIDIVRGVDFALERGEFLGIAGGERMRGKPLCCGR